jgi:non-ribosomal peptide synthetase component F
MRMAALMQPLSRDTQVRAVYCFVVNRLEIPDRYNLVDHFVDRHIREGRGAKTALISGDRQLSYGEIAKQIDLVGNGLLALGLQEEQRVLLVLPDIPEFAAAYFGTMKIGAVAVPTSTALRASDYSYFLEESRARIAIVHSMLLDEFAPALCGQRYCKHVIVCGENVDGYLHWGQLLKDGPQLEAASASKTGSPSGSGHRAALAGRKPPYTHTMTGSTAASITLGAYWTSIRAIRHSPRLSCFMLMVLATD